MRQIPAGAKYESLIWVDDEKKLIMKIDCLCGDFSYRMIKKNRGIFRYKIFCRAM